MDFSIKFCMYIEQRTQYLRRGGLTTVSIFPFHGTVHPATQGWFDRGHEEETFNQPNFRSLFELYTPNSTGGRHIWKDFEHYKCSSSISGTGQVPVVTTYHMLYDFAPAGWGYHLGGSSDPIMGFSGFGGADNPTSGLSPLYVQSLGNRHIVPEPADLEILKQRALSYTMPIIKSELSLINSLIELKDIKSLKGTVKNALTLAQSVTFVVKTQRSKLLKTKAGIVTVHELLRGVADGYLQFAFNIKPLISDIRGIYTAFANIEKRMNALITSSAKTQVKHYSVKLNELVDPPKETNYHLSALSEGTRRWSSDSHREVFSESSKFHMQVEYNFNYTRYQIEHARLLGILDSFGVSKLTSIVWNALPWSFVIDWLIGVNRYIDQFSTSFMEPVINIHRCLWSITRTRRIYCSYDMNVNMKDYPGYKTGIPASVTQETAYRRQLWEPTASSISVSGLTLSEFSLGSALVISRRRKPTRKRR